MTTANTSPTPSRPGVTRKLSEGIELADFTAGVIRIERSKNGEGRTFPFTAFPALAALLRHQREAATALERDTGRHGSHVFHRDGNPIKSYRRAWLSACRVADCTGMIAHDLRRTEMITEPALAIEFGLTIEDVTSAFHPYLTLSEGIRLAAQTFNKDVAKLSCCAA